MTDIGDWMREKARREEQKQAAQRPSAASCSNAYSGFDAVSIDGDPMSVRALKMAYRKHVKGDEDIGWDELSDTLGNALAQIMGDEEFCQWLQNN
jgi:hypothetical protein